MKDFAADQFEILLDTMAKYGYDQYEISNFAQPGYESQHNSAYWKDEKYLGIGPIMHIPIVVSFVKRTLANNAKYLKGIKEGEVPAEVITLSPEDQVNEYILTSLRTKWGCDMSRLKTKYNVDLLSEQEHYLNKLASQDLIYEDEGLLDINEQRKTTRR